MVGRNYIKPGGEETLDLWFGLDDADDDDDCCKSDMGRSSGKGGAVQSGIKIAQLAQNPQ